MLVVLLKTVNMNLIRFPAGRPPVSPRADTCSEREPAFAEPRLVHINAAAGAGLKAVERQGVLGAN